MTRAQALKFAQVHAQKKNRPMTVTYDMSTGKYEAQSGNLSFTELTSRMPTHQRVAVVWPQSAVA